MMPPAAPPAMKLPAYRWLILAALVLNATVSVMLFVSFGLLLPDILAEIGMTPVQQGWLGSAQALMGMLLTIPAAWWFSRYNPRWVFAASALAGALLVFGQAVAPGYGWLLAARLGFGLLRLPSDAVGTMIIRRWFPTHEIVLVTGIWTAVFGLVEFAVAASTPFVLGLTGSWRATVMLMGALALGAALLWLAVGREPSALEASVGKAASSEETVSVLRVLRFPVLWLACLGGLGGAAAWTSFGTFWPVYMEGTYGTPLTMLGFLFGVISLGQAPSALVVGYVAGRWRIGRSLLIGLGLLMVVGSEAALLTGSAPLLFVAMLLVGIAWGFSPILSSIPYHLPGATTRETAVASSLVNTMYNVGHTTGPVLTGFIAEWSGSAGYGLAVISLAPLLLVAAGLGYREQRATAPARSGAGKA
ncbi:MAG: MFS transporter [Chloroflexi bacterium]|nr:MFS transporter [Chloroflexota bacterium]